MSDFTTHYVTANRFLKNKNFSKDFVDAFYFGVQGPDIFFFDISKTTKKAYEIGDGVHNKCPKKLFEQDLENLKNKSDYYKGYYFGVMLHFFGDEIMHQYIGYLCTLDTSRYAHISRERDIDIFVYKDEFEESIDNFNVKEFYHMSNELVSTITKFWKERVDDDYINEKRIRKNMKSMVRLSQMFSKGKTFFYWLANLVENKKTRGGMTGHFKVTNNIEYMNYDNKKWSSPDGEKSMSVTEILDYTMKNFNVEYNKISEAIESGKEKKYTFDNTHSFSYGC